MAICASTRDLESAASVAALEAASSAASRERLRADSVSRATEYLDRKLFTGSSKGSRGRTSLNFINRY